MADIVEGTIIVKNCTIHALTAGPRDGRPVLLLHGMKFQAETWRQLGTLEQLAEAGFRAVALDMPGFGRTPACGANPEEVLAGCIAAGEFREPILVGPSMGGRICLEFALDHPGKTGALVLVGPVGVKENRQRLSSINMPVLLVWGADDTVSPPENGLLLEREIAGSRLVMIEKAPHPCYLEQPDVWHRELLSFLGNSSLGNPSQGM